MFKQQGGQNTAGIGPVPETRPANPKEGETTWVGEKASPQLERGEAKGMPVSSLSLSLLSTERCVPVAGIEDFATVAFCAESQHHDARFLGDRRTPSKRQPPKPEASATRCPNRPSLILPARFASHHTPAPPQEPLGGEAAHKHQEEQHQEVRPFGAAPGGPGDEPDLPLLR